MNYRIQLEQHFEYYLDELIAVDLTTGARTAIAPASADAAMKFAAGSVIALDPVNNRAFVTSPGSGSVIGVDIATGTRSIVTGTAGSGTVGTGDPLSRAR